MEKLPLLSAAGAVLLFTSATVHAQSETCYQECIPEPDGSGQMCYWVGENRGEYGACWEEVVYDEYGNEIWDYCTGSACTIAE